MTSVPHIPHFTPAITPPIVNQYVNDGIEPYSRQYNRGYSAQEAEIKGFWNNEPEPEVDITPAFNWRSKLRFNEL